MKFVKGNYGKEVHKCLAQKGRAPELHEVCKLPLNWKAVVMQSASVVTVNSGILWLIEFIMITFHPCHLKWIKVF